MATKLPGAPARPRRTLGWLGTTALALGGSNRSLFLIGGATGLLAAQGSAAVPLLLLGLLLSWAALPGWTELILMWPQRVGGIAATCAAALRPTSPVLASLTGLSYWWGWVPSCGLTALLSATAIHAWYTPHVPIPLLAVGLVLCFMAVNLAGIHWVVRLAIPIATASAGLAFLAGLIPLWAGRVDWHQATTYQLITPFPGIFGAVTSAMAGLYLIGLAAPAFEQAACYVGETVDPGRNVPRAMFASAGMATFYFAILPLIWLGVLGPIALRANLLQDSLGPIFAPLLGSTAHAAAIWFMMLNMFQGTLAPLAGAARTLAQLAEDGLLPAALARRSRQGAPWVATVLTAATAILILLFGNPVWVLAAASLCYLIGIGLPSLVVWRLRQTAPARARPFRAPRGTLELGVLAALVWGVATVLGFQQYGLPTVLVGLGLAYSGVGVYALRRWLENRGRGWRTLLASLHTKLSGAMFLVLLIDGAGYLLAVNSVDARYRELITLLEDIFVVVALLTITVGLILPGIIATTAREVAATAHRLATGTLADFSRAMQALATGDLEAAHARVDPVPGRVHSRDEMGAMAASFDTMQAEIARAAAGLDGAREGLRTVHDDLRARNAQLADSEERFRQLTEHVREVFWMRDVATQQVIYVSPAYAALWGRPRAQLYADPDSWLAAIHPDDRAQVALAAQTKQVQGTYDEEYRIVRPDGGQHWIRDRAFPVRDTQGTIYRIVGIADDVTAQKQAAAVLHQAKEEAEAANRAKSEFLSRMSHELRTPLNAILGFTQILELGTTTPEQDESLAYIMRGGRHLLQLINEVLDITRIESGQLTLAPESVRLADLLPETLDLVRPLAAARGIRLEIACPAGASYVLADEQRLKQVVLNLLANAIKYNREGGMVTLSCAVQGPGQLRIGVRDTGPGLSVAQQARLFTPFDRLGAEQSAVEGSGLGLALSRRLAEAMNGTMGAESTPGTGSYFWVVLPCPPGPPAPAAPPQVVAAPAADGAGPAGTVLYIEDNLSNLKLVERILEQRPHLKLLAAMQGQLGLDLAREQHPALVLLDQDLPDLAGLEVLRRLRADPATAAIPVVVLSADALPGQVARLQAAGARYYVTKPFDVPHLLAILDELLPPAEGRP